jgi:hypothetical protein
MGSFGTAKHVHIDAAVLAILLTLLIYGVKWLFGLIFPDFLFAVPTFVAIFIGCCAILHIPFLIAWSGE